MAIITLGIIDKKLLYPLIYIIVYIAIQIYWIYTEYNEVTLYIESIGFSVGQIMTVLINCIFKYKRNTKKNSQSKNYFKDFLILLIIDGFYFISNLFTTITGDDEEDTDTSRELYINDALEIIFLSLITYFILKYKYYIHHIISITAFVIFSVIIDAILENFTHTNTFTAINSILYVLADSLIYSYFKYLIENKYYYFLDVLLALGIINLSIHLISLAITFIVHNVNGSYVINTKFQDYYNEYGIGHIIFRFFFGLIFIGFLGGTLEFLMLNDLTPNYVIISYELARIPSSIIQYEDLSRWLLLIMSIFQIICLIFYLEILEFNFCSLNINTKKNISEREKSHMEDPDYNNCDDNEVNVKGYDFTESVEKQEKEMKEMEENEEKEEND